MGLLNRIRKLVTANLNDLIDDCEDPERMLRQAVRDMETALGQLMDGAARAIAHHKLLARQQSEQQQAAVRCTLQAEAAITRGDDETARRELTRKSEHQRLDDVLSRRAASASALAERLRRQVTAMRFKLAEARRKLVEITARSRAAAARRQFVAHLPGDCCRGNVWSTFETMCARVEQSEAETEALLEMLGESDVDVQIDADVEAELQALKEAVHHVTS